MVVQSHLIRGKFPYVPVQMIEYGIARYYDKQTAQLVEPLAFVSLMKWLETQEDHRILSNLRRDLSLYDSRILDYKDLLVLYLLRTLRYPVPLSTIFNIHGSAPLWENAPAQIVGGLLGVDVPVVGSGHYLRYPHFGVVGSAANPEGIINWLENADTTPPILFATHLFGADVMARVHVKLDDGNDMELIMMGRGKDDAYLDADTTIEALDSLNEDNWFEKKVDDRDRRQKLVNAIKKHNVLYFAGRGPLPPDLDLDADSDVSSTLGTNVSLAKIDLHGFEAEFLNKNEVTHVLNENEPMHVLMGMKCHKRKASVMDGR